MEDSLFANIKVRELTQNDFYIGSRTPTMLRTKACTLILFYISTDDTSADLAQLWEYLSSALASPNFWAVNSSRQTEIMRAFGETENDLNHPLRDYAIRGFPTILVYRDGWPQAFYNGELSFDALIDYATTKACIPEYREPDQMFEGVARADIEGKSRIQDRRDPNFDFRSRDSTYYNSTIGDVDVVDIDVRELEDAGLL